MKTRYKSALDQWAQSAPWAQARRLVARDRGIENFSPHCDRSRGQAEICTTQEVEMGKGSGSRFRPGGNGRTGLRDAPPGLGGRTPEQRGGAQALREMRSRAAKAGHKTRRANEAARLIDELIDLSGDDAALDARWAELTDRQRDLVSATLEADSAREAAKGKR